MQKNARLNDKKTSTSLFSIRIKFILTIITIVIALSVSVGTAIGFQLYKRNKMQFEQFITQQFFTIKRNNYYFC